MTTQTGDTDLEQSVEKLIKTGRFQSKEDVLREGVRLIEAEEEQWAELDARIARGLDDAEAGRVVPAEDVFNRLIAKYEAMSRSA